MMRRDLLATFGAGAALTLALQSAVPLVGSLFQDVPPDHPAAGAIARLSDAGIMVGNDGIFRPGDAVTRGELAIILDRMINGTPPNDNNGGGNDGERCPNEPRCVSDDSTCFYALQTFDDNGCTVDCGPLACADGHSAAPEGGTCLNLDTDCPSQPDGCRYNDPVRSPDDDNCIVECGEVMCDSGQAGTCSDEPVCEAPQGCRYEGVYNENGCRTECGNQVCDAVSTACISVESDCPELRDGCQYEAVRSPDDDNCIVECGEATCDDGGTATCPPQPECDADDGCWFENEVRDGECLIDCGNQVCPEGDNNSDWFEEAPAQE